MENIDLEHIDIEELSKKDKHCAVCIHGAICVVRQNMVSMLTHVSQERIEEQVIIDPEAINWIGNLALFCTQFIERK